jgi:hypothetical protein
MGMLDPDPVRDSVLNAGGQKCPTPRKIENGSAGCSLLRAEGSSCSLDVLYGDLGISKLQFLIKKR